MAPREPLAGDDKDLVEPSPTIDKCLCFTDDDSNTQTCRRRCAERGLSDRTLQDFQRLRCKLTLTINENWTTVTYHQLPRWMQHTPYLLSGHRPQLSSLRVAFKSVFRFHSETINIWSHFFGFLLFSYLCGQFFAQYRHVLDRSYLIMAFIWFLGQIVCCGLSTVYHTFMCHSDHLCTKLAKCDYLGIFASCWATLITAGYYCLYCHPKALLAWLTLCVIVFAIGPRLVLTENNLHRVLIYSAVVLPNLFAFLVSISELMVYHPHMVGPAIYYLVGTYGFPMTAAFLYLQKVPEKFWPGKFDLIGHSHQLMHFLVLGCMLSQHQLLLIATELRLNGRCDNY